jgi:hypothetical protein
LAGAFLAGACLAGAFLAGAFFAGAPVAGVFLAGALVAVVVFVAVSAEGVVPRAGRRPITFFAAAAAEPANDRVVLRAIRTGSLSDLGKRDVSHQ